MLKSHIQLSQADKAPLKDLLSKGQLPVKTFKRSQALLALDQGKTLEAVAESIGVVNDTVARWRNEYKTTQLKFLYDKPGSGRPIEISGQQRANITALACSQAPEGHSQWSLRLLADKVVELGYCEHLWYVYAGEILKKMS